LHFLAYFTFLFGIYASYFTDIGRIHYLEREYRDFKGRWEE
jgi:hypothetical protein